MISDELYSNPSNVGRLLFFKGGPVMSSSPSEELIGSTNMFVGGPLAVGKFRHGGPQYLIEQHGTLGVLLYPLGKTFSLFTPDSATFPFDAARYCCFSDGFGIVSSQDSSVDLIGIAGIDQHYFGGSGADRVVLICTLQDSLQGKVVGYLHCPFQTSSERFGANIVRVGNVTGRGYPTLLVTDPDASLGTQENGAIFLFNMGKALSDSCVGYAPGHGFEDMFGTTAIALGDVSGDGRNDFMVAGANGLNGITGYVTVFLGDSSYGPMTAVREIGVIPTALSLQQNFPNPFSSATTITFDVPSTEIVRLDIYDALGRIVATPVQGQLPTGRYATSISARSLPAGEYGYRLICGRNQVARMMTILK